MKQFNVLKCEQPQNSFSRGVDKKKGPVELQPGILCVDYLYGSLKNILYRSKVTDYGRYFDFVFNYINVGSYWEIDIVRFPDYRGRSTSAYVIHTLPSDRGGRKICVATGHEPRSERDAKKLSMSWADLQAEYIKTGKTPDDQIRDNHR